MFVQITGGSAPAVLVLSCQTKDKNDWRNRCVLEVVKEMGVYWFVSLFVFVQ